MELISSQDYHQVKHKVLLLKSLLRNKKLHFSHTAKNEASRKSEIINKFVRNMKQTGWTNINWNWSHTEKKLHNLQKEKKRVKSFSQHCNKLQLQSVGKKSFLCLFLLGFLSSVQREVNWVQASEQLRRRRGELRLQQSRLTFSQILFGMEKQKKKEI